PSGPRERAVRRGSASGGREGITTGPQTAQAQEPASQDGRGRRRGAPRAAASLDLVPKLCLGTPSAKLRFALPRETGVSAQTVPKQEFGNEGNRSLGTRGRGARGAGHGARGAGRGARGAGRSSSARSFFPNALNRTEG